MLRSASKLPEEAGCANAVGIVIEDQPIKNKGMIRVANGLRFADILFKILHLDVARELVACCSDALEMSGCPSSRQ